jgi:hypothetical protein
VLADRLDKAWRARKASADIDPAMQFADAGLVFGAGTLLAPAGPSGREVALDPHRLTALLAAAHLKAPAAQGLVHLTKAVESWNRGEDALAAMHLALSGLGRLARPRQDAHRLFLAYGLLEAGLDPDSLVRALGLGEVAGETVGKYSPDQPRVPAGSGRTSGQWTTGAAASGAPDPGPQRRRPSRSPRAPHPPRRPPRSARSPVHSQAQAGVSPSPGAALPRIASMTAVAGTAPGVDLGAMTADALTRLGSFLAGVLAEAGPAAVLGLGFALIPSPAGPEARRVHVGGPGDVSVFIDPDVTEVIFHYTTADGIRREWKARPGPGVGTLAGPDGRVIARRVRVARTAELIIDTAALLGNENDEGRLCPAPKAENHGVRGREYEDFMKPQFNRGNPTPSGMGYAFTDPKNGKAVVFDDCQQRTGRLAEYKGLTYARLTRLPFWERSTLRKLLQQADRQDRARQGRPLTWYVNDYELYTFLEPLFEKIHPGISVVWKPMTPRK